MLPFILLLLSISIRSSSSINWSCGGKCFRSSLLPRFFVDIFLDFDPLPFNLAVCAEAAEFFRDQGPWSAVQIY